MGKVSGDHSTRGLLSQAKETEMGATEGLIHPQDDSERGQMRMGGLN